MEMSAVVQNKKDRFAKLISACIPVLEQLEERRLFSASTIQTLPFLLDFNSDRGELVDKDGQGTGFTRVQANKNGNEYQPALIDLDTAAGVLKITTTGNSAAGSNSLSDNTQVDALETQFDGTSSGFTITARLKGPLSFINDNYEQGGIFFGPDQDNFVKLVALKGGNGQVLQFKDEQNGSTTALPTAAQNFNIGSFASISTLDVRMVGDAATGKVSAYYAINGSNFVKVPYDLTLTGSMKAKFFTSAARAGLLQSHKNDVGPITVTYDSFEIKAGTPVTGHPFVTATRPDNTENGVSRDAFVAADVSLPTPGAGVDAATLSTTTVLLYRTSDHAMVPGVVNTTGGGDAIVYQPTDYLAANTSYTFEITAGVKDTAGSTFVPYATTFTTGSTGGPTSSNIAFDKVSLNTTNGSSYTSVKVGPDHKLYATTIDGHIVRWSLNADGTLGTSQIIDTIINKEGGARAIIGLTFDPSSTANNLIAYVTQNAPSLENAPDWSGKITKLTGANLSTATDLITGLPRSIRDHMTNQMVFGPDGALYISQASVNAMGAPDNAWGLRSEHLLNAAILRLDLSKLGSSPLNVKTEGTGAYNPYAAGAALTIYATGVRNSYDLIWTSTGHLYASTNGSAANGATPASPDGTIKGISPVTTTEDDFFYDIKQGKYYGHPNPTRGEYVLDGGNPTSGLDNILPNGNYAQQFTQYPVGTQPDSNYEGAIWDYGKNYSPNGMLEYKGNAFGGALDGKILVVRYSGGDDIIVLSPNASGSKITSAQTGIAGFTQFVDPLDIAEDNSTGFLYVAEYGGQKLTLLKPISTNGANIDVSKKAFYFNDIQSSSSGGSGSSPTQTLKITNNGTASLLLDANAFTITGGDASQFKVSGLPALPYSLGAGQSLNVLLSFTASSTGVKAATLNINSNASNATQMQVTLRGIGTTGVGASNEPSLQRIMDLYQIPVNVGDNNSADTTFPMPPTTPNDEVVMPRLVKAGNGSVTVELLGVFANNDVNGPSLGYYEPGTTENKTILFNTSSADAQSVNATPNGNTSFDPGSSMFSLMAVFPKFTNREVYSEDSLNTWESNAANRRKVRFYQLKNSDGTVVPNAYVFAFEEYNVTYDQNDIVGIIRNVKAAPSGAEIGVQNMDGGPFADRLVFNRIENVDPLVPNVVHDQATLRIKNTGSSTLNITDMVLSAGFSFVSGGGAATIAAGATKDVTIKFTASGVDITNGTLKIISDDSDESTKTIQLVGWWQSHSENNGQGISQEPTLAEVMQTFGYTSVVGTKAQLDTGGLISKVGEEVLSPYWNRADTNAPVTVRMLAAFHQQKTTTASNVKYYYQGASGTKTNLFTHNYTEGQSFFPHLTNSTTATAQATFSPTAGKPFGLYVDGKFSDDSLNPLDNNTPNTGHSFRFYIAKDRNGQVIANTYIMAMDYTGVSYSNYDYQDNIYLVTNVKPLSAPTAPTGMNSSSSGSGIKVSWTKNTEGNVAGYRIYRSDSANGTFTLLNSSLVTTNNYTDILAPVGVTSYYRVTAVDVHGSESAYNTTSATRTADTVAPAAPTGLVINGLVSGISLNWDDNTEGDLAGYDVYRSTSANGTFTKLNASKLTTSDFVDTTAPSGSTSFYRVYAIDTSTNQSGFVGGSATRPTSGSVPTAASNLAIVSSSASGVSLTWADNSSNEVNFRIERKVGANGTFVPLITLNANTTSYIDTSVLAGNQYFYQVVATGSGGDAAPSNSVSASIPGATGQYSSADIGNPAVSGGTSTITDGVDYDITGGGLDVYNSSDQFQFAYKQLTGDFDMKVQVNSLTGADSQIMAGLMARESLAANSKNAYIKLRPAGFRFNYRASTGGSTSATGTGAATAPNSWLRLVRSGNTFSGYGSTDGTNWSLIGSTSITMGSTLYFGMAVSGHSATTNAVAQFRGLSNTGQAISPTAPSNLVATANTSDIGLAWQDNSNNEDGFIIERKTGNGSFGTVFTTAANVTTWTDTNAVAGTTYTYRVSAKSTSLGNSTPSNESSATIQNPQQQDSFTSGNIGDATGGNTTVVTPDKDYDITANGSNIFYNVDGMRFTYKQVTGDFDVQVRIASVTTANSDPLAGIMARASLSSGSANAIMRTYGSSPNQYKFGYRTTDGGSTSSVGGGTNSYPNSWVRLVRTGNTFTGYYSTNGTSWTNLGSTSIAMGNTVYVGMAVASRATTTETVQFRDLKITQAVATPSAPSSLSAIGGANKVDLNWTDNSSTETGFIVERKTGSGGTYAPIFTTGANATTYTDTDVTAGTQYFYRVSATNSGGTSSPTNEDSATPTAPAVQTIGFTSVDIGATGAAGSTTEVTPGSAYDVTGSGRNVWDNSDQLQFAYTQATGDFDFKARINSVTTANSDPLVGLMARASLSANAMNVFMRTYGSSPNQYKFGSRVTTGGTTASAGTGTNSYPNTWVRLVRTGNTFIGYSSSNGTTWTEVSRVTINTMPSTIYIGMAIASRVTGSTETAQFRDISLT